MATQDKKTAQRSKRSIKLKPQEAIAYTKYANSFDTIQDCADALGLDRVTVTRIRDLKRCGQDTYNMLLAKGIITQQQKQVA